MEEGNYSDAHSSGCGLYPLVWWRKALWWEPQQLYLPLPPCGLVTLINPTLGHSDWLLLQTAVKSCLKIPGPWACSWGEITPEEVLPDAFCDLKKKKRIRPCNNTDPVSRKAVIPAWLLRLLIKILSYMICLFYSFSLSYTKALSSSEVLRTAYWAFISGPNSSGLYLLPQITGSFCFG